MDLTLNLSFFGSLFIYGITSSVHCVFMCGPFLSVLNTEKNSLFPIVFYQLGRVLSYVIIGMLLGFLGKGANALGELTNVQSMAGIFAFIFLILLGLRLISFNSVNFNLKIPKFFTHFTVWIRKRFSLKGLGFGIGLTSGLLPCGVLYPAYAASFATGSVLFGGLTMAFFYFGTLPALLSLGFVTGIVRKHIQTKWIPLFGVILITISVGFIVYRIFYHSHSESCDHIL
ncbi:sulfite exporter TauE/SafE family protein [Leptospira sp. 96542]|nr:sulfite exporter TauE/SafE family protein [Leptospira sp. 96542]